jgi:hypothetical protein
MNLAKHLAAAHTIRTSIFTERQSFDWNKKVGTQTNFNVNLHIYLVVAFYGLYVDWFHQHTNEEDE